ncbi:MAG: energy transducer TonB [Candidatus Krumholzibacteria bacterium]|nr:energy transducer TonB [Candidatus Krumholzibacteria bacterium]
MKHSCWERDEAYRRRLRVVTPIAVLLVAALFLTSDRVSFQDLEQHIGWKGELRMLPEITIIAEEELEPSEEHRQALQAMRSFDIELPEGADFAASLNEGRAEDDAPVEVPEFDPFDLPTVEARREAPYSQDFVLLKMVEPVYPPEALRAGMEGHVTVELLVDEQGRVAHVTVLSALGPKSFQDASLLAVRQFLFQPPMDRGVPTPMWIKFRIKFRIFG